MHSLLRLPAVKNKTGLGRSSIYLKIKLGEFPAPVSLGARSVAWVESEVSAWVANRISERDILREDAGVIDETAARGQR
jgi:prophage regulatory protein